MFVSHDWPADRAFWHARRAARGGPFGELLEDAGVDAKALQPGVERGGLDAQHLRCAGGAGDAAAAAGEGGSDRLVLELAEVVSTASSSRTTARICRGGRRVR